MHHFNTNIEQFLKLPDKAWSSSSKLAGHSNNNNTIKISSSRPARAMKINVNTCAASKVESHIKNLLPYSMSVTCTHT